MTDSTESRDRPGECPPPAVDVQVPRPTAGPARTRPGAAHGQLDPGRRQQHRQPTAGVERAPDEEVADLCARLAAAEDRADHLERALASNRRIGVAVGILMTRLRCTEEQAFGLLRQESMRRNVRVSELAEQVVYTGTL